MIEYGISVTSRTYQRYTEKSIFLLVFTNIYSIYSYNHAYMREKFNKME